MPSVAVAWAWLPEGLRRRVVVGFTPHGAVTEVRDARSDEAVEDGLLLPGLVNAHAHLELSQLRGQVPGGHGSVAWVEAMMDVGLPPDPAANDAAAAEAKATGTRWLVDVSNRGDTEAHLRAAGLGGVVQVECLGVDPGRWRPRVEAAGKRGGSRQVALRPTAHSPISCSPDCLVTALGRPGGRRGPAPTIHVDEDPADALLLKRREGPWAAFHDRIGHDWRGGLALGPSGVAVLDDLGLLDERIGLVHLVAAGPRDLDRVAQRGATAILCPRSNQHIGGRLPDGPGMVQRGIPLALGTDSLASTPDLDLLAEAAVLADAFPDVDPAVWVTAMTTGGARLLGDVGAGRIRAGTFPGLLKVDLPETDDPLRVLLDGTRWPRRWVA